MEAQVEDRNSFSWVWSQKVGTESFKGGFPYNDPRFSGYLHSKANRLNLNLLFHASASAIFLATIGCTLRVLNVTHNSSNVIYAFTDIGNTVVSNFIAMYSSDT